MKAKQLKMTFYELEKEKQKEILVVICSTIFVILCTTITILALAQVIPFWIFPVPFTSTLLAVILVLVRNHFNRRTSNGNNTA